jgi:hypothetical protein
LLIGSFPEKPLNPGLSGESDAFRAVGRSVKVGLKCPKRSVIKARSKDGLHPDKAPSSLAIQGRKGRAKSGDVGFIPPAFQALSDAPDQNFSHPAVIEPFGYPETWRGPSGHIAH